MRKIIKNLSLLGIFFISLNVHSLQGLNVITITTDDPQGYVEWLTESQPVFQAAQGDNAAAQGICSPVAGGEFTNEHYVWTISPSISAMMSNPEFFTDKDVARALRKIANKREVVRRDLMYVIKEAAIDGVGVTNSQYNLTSKTNDVEGYVEALTAMEKAAAANGFDDISVALFGSLAGGDRALTVMASIQAPTPERLGAFFDERQSGWMTEAVADFNALRTPVIDFMMQCTTLSVNN
ncbi:MAG: hypothetical protein VXZ61_05930 [Pseudomonadota bacterium]|nr:hypothetical protein [Pseudomonadota bacterium]MEC8449299.1 hypothetical protein [Pseudomonadota bacterium]MEC8799041.1 hypothetical protein [Pseudomonadota bacterium]GIR87517.1 MAG: hypothetical protein CM15mP86_09760 [Gammaproteobacteria bacterium]|tara:strand:+ start:3674 stop:4387 length:714 start_codon:yes stop_codon:yes gene_type:complete